MLILVAVVALIAGCTALVLVPPRLPWPQRVHWLVATNALGYFGLPTEPTTMTEVRVVDVCDGDPTFWVVIRAAGVTKRETTLVLAEAAPFGTGAQLARWRAAGTPLLFMSDRSASVSLHGPTSAVCGLAVLETTGVQEDSAVVHRLTAVSPGSPISRR